MSANPELSKCPLRGKVYLVGAGPGEPGLFTLKGRDVLSKAGVVIYDALVNPKILSFAKKSALKIYAGKKGRAGLLQGEINRLMADHALKGKTVARLKGGDPFVFGRGGEEAEFLSERDIPFEVVPGVSSVSAVPAYAGIPVTDRRHTSMLTVVTGHSGDTQLNSNKIKLGVPRSEDYGGPGVDWNKISPQGTLVILMGVEKFPGIVRRLIQAGWPPSTSVALVRSGTLKNQTVVTGKLEDITGKLKKMKGKFPPPAVIVVGSVVGLRKKIAWFA